MDAPVNTTGETLARAPLRSFRSRYRSKWYSCPLLTPRTPPPPRDTTRPSTSRTPILYADMLSNLASWYDTTLPEVDEPKYQVTESRHNQTPRSCPRPFPLSMMFFDCLVDLSSAMDLLLSWNGIVAQKSRRCGRNYLRITASLSTLFKQEVLERDIQYQILTSRWLGVVSEYAQGMQARLVRDGGFVWFCFSCNPQSGKTKNRGAVGAEDVCRWRIFNEWKGFDVGVGDTWQVTREAKPALTLGPKQLICPSLCSTEWDITILLSNGVCHQLWTFITTLYFLSDQCFTAIQVSSTVTLSSSSLVNAVKATLIIQKDIYGQLG